MIEFPSEFNINFNVDVLDDTGFVVVVLSFRYLRTSRMNQAQISLKYANNSNVCDNWFFERDNLILAKLNFNKTSKIITPEVSTIIQSKSCTVNGKVYEIYPYNLTIKQLQPVLQDIYTRLP